MDGNYFLSSVGSEHLPYKQGVAGSNPAGSTQGDIAQGVEQDTVNVRVGGSRPSISAMEYFCDNKRHLVCLPYSVENLHIMAKELNIKSCWFHSGAKPHYDIPKTRVEEISSKCTMVSSKFILQIIIGR